MIPVSLTALTRATHLVEQKTKTRNFFPRKTLQNFFVTSFNFSSFNLISRIFSKRFFPTTAKQYSKKKAKAEMNSQFTFNEDQERQTQPLYVCSDENETVSPCSLPIPQLSNNVPDTHSAIAQLIAAHGEQMSSSGNFSLQYLCTPPFSLLSDDDNDEMFNPIFGNPAQLTPYTPNRRPQPLRLCQRPTHIPDTPEPPTLENHGQSDIFRPHNLSENPIRSAFLLPTTVTEGLQDLSLHAHIKTNAYVTGCLV